MQIFLDWFPGGFIIPITARLAGILLLWLFEKFKFLEDSKVYVFAADTLCVHNWDLE